MPENPISTPNMPLETVAFNALSTDRALAKAAERGFEVGSVIDVGASNGSWSAVCERHFRNSRYLLVEAQTQHEAALISYCSKRPNSEYVIAAAGDKVGVAYFDDSSLFGGVASPVATTYARKEVRMTTLDAEVVSRGLPGPYLLKLDTHGFEVPILQGAKAHVLRNASIVIIETYNFRILNDSLLMDEMVRYMRDLGFAVVDICEPLWRRRDGFFWQIDLLFAPSSRPEFEINTYE
jgi:FkbM family methyltransferase